MTGKMLPGISAEEASLRTLAVECTQHSAASYTAPTIRGGSHVTNAIREIQQHKHPGHVLLAPVLHTLARR